MRDEKKRQECIKVGRSLPFQSTEKICTELIDKGHYWANYHFVYRVLNGRFKRWDEGKHGVVLSEAKKVMNETVKSITNKS